MNIQHILEQPRFKTNVLNNSQCCQNMMTLFSRNGLIRNMEHRDIGFSKIGKNDKVKGNISSNGCKQIPKVSANRMKYILGLFLVFITNWSK